MKRIRNVLIGLILAVAVPGWATTYTVCSSGCDETTIQAVFDNNDLGTDDIIDVTDSGIYRELVTWGSNDGGSSGQPVVLRSTGGASIYGSEEKNDAEDWTNEGGGGESGGLLVVDLEEGDTSDWTSTQVGGTATVAASEGSKHEGIYGMVVTGDGSTLTIYGEKTFTETDDVYVRIYFYIPDGASLGASGSTRSIRAFSINDGTTICSSFLLKQDYDVSQIDSVTWSLETPWVGEQGHTDISTNTWYYTEMRYKGGDADTGGAQFWLNGVSKYSSFIQNTSTAHPDRARVGSLSTYQGSGVLQSAHTLYFDDIKGDTSQVGAYSGSSGNLWYATVTSEPNLVWRDTGGGFSPMTEVAAKEDCDSDGEWWWDSGNTRVYVYDTDNPTTGSVKFEIPQRANCIAADANVDYVTVDGLICQFANEQGILASTGRDYWTVQTCSVAYTYKTGIYFNACSNAQAIGNTVSYCGNMPESPDPTTAPQTGIVLDTITTGLVQANEVSYTGRTGILINADSSNVTAEYNEVHHTGQVGHHGYGIQMYGITGTAQTGTIVRHNKLHDNGNIDIYFLNKVSGPKVYGNICDNPKQNAKGSDWFANIAVDNTTGTPGDDTSSLELSNNTFYLDSTDKDAYNIYVNYVDGVYPAKIEGALINNNIIVNDELGQLAYSTYSSVTHTIPPTFNYNRYDINNSNIVYYEGNTRTFATFQSEDSQEANGSSGDPLMTDPANGDFTLQPSSPCIDAGVDLGDTYDDGLDPDSSWPDSVLTLDQDSYGSGWEIGAYIYESGKPVLSGSIAGEIQ